ncbi:hypothetical protein VIGAN_01215300 [Vigna angularis var. angularis]|uniref:Uncharacterized protein n=1 Tax=Vigna angularis var. angularis TaxID=157739 RepID=A0A0S3R1L7_PHAAN|nr:hypothetical protein VIGAN_01215300 [Vigna angularis var. angularis]
MNDLALHPSGECALTVARDNCLTIFNLIRGSRNYCLCLDKELCFFKFFKLECSKPVFYAAPVRICASSNSFSVFSNYHRISSWLFLFSLFLLVLLICLVCLKTLGFR